MPSSIYVADVAMTAFVGPGAGAVYFDMGSKPAVSANAGLATVTAEKLRIDRNLQ
jgi:hypothetical protein